MDLNLTFVNSCISGDGNDDVGMFLIHGRYDAEQKECYWTKTYPGSHEVHYTGYREGKGIWGRWKIGPLDHGGFHIWPGTHSEGEAAAAANTALHLAKAIAVDPPSVSPGISPHEKEFVSRLGRNDRPAGARLLT
jgi:hypothetical protein